MAEHDEHEQVKMIKEDDSAKWLGWGAILASIIAFFIFPFVMGGIGIVLGIFGLRSEARTLCWWAIALGITAIFFRWFY